MAHVSVKLAYTVDYPITPKWDVPGKDYFDELLRVSKHVHHMGLQLLRLSLLHPAESFGTSATAGLRFLTAKLLQPTCLILSACSGICGTA